MMTTPSLVTRDDQIPLQAEAFFGDEGVADLAVSILVRERGPPFREDADTAADPNHVGVAGELAARRVGHAVTPVPAVVGADLDAPVGAFALMMGVREQNRVAIPQEAALNPGRLGEPIIDVGLAEGLATVGADASGPVANAVAAARVHHQIAVWQLDHGALGALQREGAADVPPLATIVGIDDMGVRPRVGVDMTRRHDDAAFVWVPGLHDPMYRPEPRPPPLAAGRRIDPTPLRVFAAATLHLAGDLASR